MITISKCKVVIPNKIAALRSIVFISKYVKANEQAGNKKIKQNRTSMIRNIVSYIFSYSQV